MGPEGLGNPFRLPSWDLSSGFLTATTFVGARTVPGAEGSHEQGGKVPVRGELPFQAAEAGSKQVNK